MLAAWHAVTPRQQAMASLFWTISSHDTSAIEWLREQQITVAQRYGGCFPDPSPADMHAWAAANASNPEWQSAKADAQHPWRQAWQWWVVERAVAESAMTQLRKGLRLPAFYITDSIRACWDDLPQSPASRRRLRSFVTTPHAGKNFRRNFRSRFDLRWGPGQPRRALGTTMIARRARIYLQWLQWLRQEASPGTVFLNMDETRLSSIREWKNGIVAKHPMLPEQCPTATPAPPVTNRTTLMATVCSRDDWQPLIPQIRLPRCKPGKLAPRKERAALHRAGAPLQVWHGTRGVATTGIIRRWMTCIRGAVDRQQPGTAIILILDCCPAHLSRIVLNHAARLHIRLVIIPARLTWLLQPLDTHVFAQLKNDIRSRLARICIARDSGHVSTADAISTHGESIADVVSGRPWSASMKRTGATGETGNLRPAIRSLIGDDPMEPRRPTIDDLACMLNVSHKRAAAIAPQLTGEGFPDPPRVGSERTAALATSTGAASSTARRAEPVPLPRVLRLPVVRRRRDGRQSSPARLIMMPATAPTAHAMTTRSRTRWLTAADTLRPAGAREPAMFVPWE